MEQVRDTARKLLSQAYLAGLHYPDVSGFWSMPTARWPPPGKRRKYDPILEFSNLVRSFKRNVPVLNGVTFALEAGEVAGLLGRNGAGKTTLIRIAMGMLFPHGGSVRVFGESPAVNPVGIKRRIGYVAEDQVLPPTRASPSCRAAPVPVRQVGWRAGARVARAFRPRPYGAHQTLSKGQARQVALLCAVCHRRSCCCSTNPPGDWTRRRGESSWRHPFNC